MSGMAARTGRELREVGGRTGVVAVTVRLVLASVRGGAVVVKRRRRLIRMMVVVVGGTAVGAVRRKAFGVAVRMMMVLAVRTLLSLARLGERTLFLLA